MSATSEQHIPHQTYWCQQQRKMNEFILSHADNPDYNKRAIQALKEKVQLGRSNASNQECE